MSAYLIVGLEIRDADAFGRYRARVSDNIAAYGGRYVVRGGGFEILEGAWAPKRIVVLEFPDMAALKRWYDSEDYAPLKALRQAAAATDAVAVEGLAG